MARETYVYRNGKMVLKHLARPLGAVGPGVGIIKDLEPYRNTVDGKVVGGRRQHRDFLRAYELTEVGDQAPREAPRAPPNVVDHKLVETIKRHMGKL